VVIGRRTCCAVARKLERGHFSALLLLALALTTACGANDLRRRPGATDAGLDAQPAAPATDAATEPPPPDGQTPPPDEHVPLPDAGPAGTDSGATIRDAALPVDARVAGDASPTHDGGTPPPPAFALTVAVAGSGVGKVTGAPAVDCPGKCTATYEEATEAVLTATPDATSVFAGWTGACSGSSPTCTVAIGEATSVTATFAKKTFALTLASAGSGAGLLTVSKPNGVTCNGSCPFDDGTEITIVAVPANGSTFGGFTGCDTTTASTCTVTMTQPHKVTATFSLTNLAIAVQKTGAGSGTVTSNTGGIACGASCGGTFAFGATVTLTALAATGSTFGAFTGCDSTTGATCKVAVTKARTVTASFSLDSETLSVSKTGNGTGTVTSNTGGIACGATCSSIYGYGTSVTLTATAGTGSTFAGFTGCDRTSGLTCTVSVSSARGVQAEFDFATYDVQVTDAGNGAGTVTANAGALNCGGVCTASYTYGSSVTLTAAPSVSSNFTGWSGCDSSSGTSCTVSVTNTRAVAATFTLKTFTVNAIQYGSGSGNITSTSGSITCGGGPCSAQVDYGTTLDLQELPNGGSYFAGWLGCPAQSGNDCVWTVTDNVNVAADFEPVTYTLTVTSSPTNGDGTSVITDNFGRLNCNDSGNPGTCTAQYNQGAAVTLFATYGSANRYYFVPTCDSFDGSGNCILNMTSDRSITANFYYQPPP
jgi:uncharacterized repeat protein (TIGR02543 family)